MTTNYVGYFEKADDKEPAYDPGIDGVPCPVCHCGLLRFDLKTISVANMERSKSLFYRVHKSCYESLNEQEQNALDCFVTGITDTQEEPQ